MSVDTKRDSQATRMCTGPHQACYRPCSQRAWRYCRFVWACLQAALRALQQRQMLKEERELLQHALVAGIGSSRAGLSSARQEIEQDMHQEVGARIVIKFTRSS